MKLENENLNESQKPRLNISRDVINRLSDDKIDNIIYELDEYARIMIGMIMDYPHTGSTWKI